MHPTVRVTQSTMVYRILNLFLLLVLAVPLAAQSGRVKKKEDKKDEKKPAGKKYNPTQKVKPTPKPTKTPPPGPNERLRKVGENTADEIRVDSTLVPIPVSVIDNATGKALEQLRLQDFELAIDGEPAIISEIFRSESPVRLALLFDNSSSVTVAREFEQTAAIRFFRRVLRPRLDLAALYSVASVTYLEQPLTKDVRLLINAIKAFPQPEGATALHDSIIEASNYLKEQRGRKVIVVVSDGQDTLSDYTFDTMVQEVQKNNCQVYIVHTNEFENFKRTGARTGSANLRALAAERRMRSLAAQTGGAVYSPIDERELDLAFSQISAELSSQYILGYYPENEVKDGGFRKIDLNVITDSDITVRSRTGYFAGRKGID
ncbi:MAG: VWA domain-containing protein [Pyrinomonadaceae bacterium]|nr:VWA domain-containing protein [Pyrinomonadaceae bacterium]